MKRLLLLLITLSTICVTALAGCEAQKPNADNNNTESITEIVQQQRNADIVQDEQDAEIEDDNNDGEAPAEPDHHRPRRRSGDGCPHCRHREPHFRGGRKNLPAPMPAPEQP